MSSNPIAELGIREVFVAGPFFALVKANGGTMSEADISQFTVLIDYFEQAGCKVYNAHRREAWGAQFLTAPEATKLDLTEISQSDVFVGFPGSPASPGTHVEIGWASGLNKPMVLLMEKGAKYTFLVTGLQSIAPVEYLEYTDPAEITDQLPGAIERAMRRAAELAGPQRAAS